MQKKKSKWIAKQNYQTYALNAVAYAARMSAKNQSLKPRGAIWRLLLTNKLFVLQTKKGHTTLATKCRSI